MRGALLLVGTAFVAGCFGLPERDTFVPPYAAKGCWARFYGEPAFAGPVRQIEGPVFVEALAAAPVVVPNIEKIPPQPLFREARSLVIGPHARLAAFPITLFRGPALELAPGTQVPELSAIAFQEKAASFTLRCAPNAG